MLSLILFSLTQASKIFYLKSGEKKYLLEEIKEEGSLFKITCTDLNQTDDFYLSIIKPLQDMKHVDSSDEDSEYGEEYKPSKEHTFSKKGIYKIRLSNYHQSPIKISVRSFVETSYPLDENQQKLREVVSALESLLSSTYEANMQLKENKTTHIKEIKSMVNRSFFVCLLAGLYFVIGFYKVDRMKKLFVKRK
ncbi:hypothetical protein H311_03216 [Anncaliia algerae PRA109]|nr:hypothetical protein H311_03216 [Anncaliia algerae PRA109]